MLGRKATGPRNVVLPHDPAIDQKASNWKRYEDSLYTDESALVFLPGQTPTKWAVRPLTRRQKNALPAFAGNARNFADFVFRCGVLRIDGYQLESADGTTCPITEPTRETLNANGDLIKDDWMDSADLPREDIDGAAAVIINLSEARPLSCKPCGQPAGLST